MKKKFFLMFLMICASFVITLSLCSNVFAEGRWGSCFFNVGQTCGAGLIDYVTHDVIPSGLWGINTKEQFVNRIDSLYHGSNEQEKIGASFLIRQLLDLTHDAVSEADFDDFKKRVLGNNDLYIDQGFYEPYPVSYYDPVKKDDFYAEAFRPKDILILRTNATIYAEIEIGCGNMAANPTPMPKQWSVVPYTSVYSQSNQKLDTSSGPAEVLKGTSVFWKVAVTNLGPTVNNKDIKYTWADAGGFGGRAGTQKTVKSGELQPGKYSLYGINGYHDNGDVANYSNSVNDLKFTPTQADVNKTFCIKTNVIPRSGDDPSEENSEPACIKVVDTLKPPVSNNDCRPISIHIEVPKAVHLPAQEPVIGGSQGSGSPSIVVPVHIRGEGQDNEGKPKTVERTVTKTSDQDFTLDCTTGSEWKFRIWTDEYTSGDYDVCTGGYDQYNNCMGWTHYNTNTRTDYPVNLKPCFDYRLDPSISKEITSQYQVEINSLINLTPSLATSSYTYGSSDWQSYIHKGTHTRSKPNSEWQVVQLVIPKGSSVPTISKAFDSRSPCSYYQGKLGGSCTVLKEGKGQFAKVNNGMINSASISTVGKTAVIIDDKYQAGTKICFAFSVHAGQSDPSFDSFSLDAEWVHSPIRQQNDCVIVVKKPKVQVWGGDLSVGKSIDGSVRMSDVVATTSTKLIGGSVSGGIRNGGEIKTFGSWVEYGIFASRNIQGMGSGSAFADRWGLSVDPYDGVCDYSRLSFTNAGGQFCSPSSPKGGYVSARSIPDPFSGIVGVAMDVNITNITPSNLLGKKPGKYIGETTNNLRINGGLLTAGQTVIIKTSGKVTIAGDQMYAPGPYKGISQIPQLIIIAGSIDIEEHVGQVDAWLVARSGPLNTCSKISSPGQSFSAADCSLPLRINGPVMAQKIYMFRTAGSETLDNSGAPAEIFNLRPDSYLWAFNRATEDAKVYSVYTAEAPPRY